MSVILGTMVHVSVDSTTDGFQSISWNINRQPNRLWQLGEWYPWKTQVGTIITVNITSYASALDPVYLHPAVSCDDSDAVKSISIVAAACDPNVAVSLNYDKMYITSYSYSKGDPIGFGTESWSFQRWIESGVAGDFITIPEPTAVLQGITEGSLSGNIIEAGLEFADDATMHGEHIVTGQQGSVSAGIPGIGEATNVQLGIVSKIGGGT